MKIEKNKIILLISTLCLVMLIGSTSAAESDINNTDIESNLNEVDLEYSKDTYLLKENSTDNSLSDLNNEIKSATGELNLTKNYNFNNSTDSLLKNGIPITNDLIVNGNGHTIDGSNQARIFNIMNNSNVTFINVTFINGHAPDGQEGGAIRGDTGSESYKVINCTFTNNNANWGGAMYGGTAYNCKFNGNTASWGGAVCNSNTYNCKFTYNVATYIGGAISSGNAYNATFYRNKAVWGGAVFSCNAYNSLFESNEATSDGGAMLGGNAYNSIFNFNNAYKGGSISCGNVYNSIFSFNEAYEGGAIFGTDAYNCTFLSNHAVWGGAISDVVYNGMSVKSVYNSTFRDNTASNGGAMYFANAYNCTFINNYDLDGIVVKFGYYDTDCQFVRNNPNVRMTINNITVDSKIKITIRTNKLYSGTLRVEIGSSNYYVDVVKGSGSLYVSGLAVGNYRATVFFGETSYFYAVSPSTVFKVSAHVYKLTLNKVTVKKSAKKLTLKVTLIIDGKKLKNKNVKFTFNKKTYSAKTNVNGIAQVTIKQSVLKTLKVGKKLTYSANYLTKTVKKTVIVKK